MKYIEDSVQFDTRIKEYMKTKPKLFLDFWARMSKKEFQYVCEKLNKEGILLRKNDSYYVSMTFENVEQIYYNSFSKSLGTQVVPLIKASLYLDPDFSNDTLTAIKLQMESRKIGELMGIKIGSKDYYLSGPSLVSLIPEESIMQLYISKYNNPSKQFINDFKKTGLIGDSKKITWILNDKVIQIDIAKQSFDYSVSPLDGEYHKLRDATNNVIIIYEDLFQYKKEVEFEKGRDKELKNDIKNTKKII